MIPLQSWKSVEKVYYTHIWITYLHNIKYTIIVLPDFRAYSVKIINMIHNKIAAFKIIRICPHRSLSESNKALVTHTLTVVSTVAVDTLALVVARSWCGDTCTCAVVEAGTCSTWIFVCRKQHHRIW